MHLSGGGCLGSLEVHCGECGQTHARAAVAVEPVVAPGGVPGGVVQGDAQGGDGGDVSALSGVRGGALSVDDDELNCEDFADCMFWFKSFSYSR